MAQVVAHSPALFPDAFVRACRGDAKGRWANVGPFKRLKMVHGGSPIAEWFIVENPILN